MVRCWSFVRCCCLSTGVVGLSSGVVGVVCLSPGVVGLLSGVVFRQVLWSFVRFCWSFVRCFWSFVRCCLSSGVVGLSSGVVRKTCLTPSCLRRDSGRHPDPSVSRCPPYCFCFRLVVLCLSTLSKSDGTRPPSHSVPIHSQ